jgi:hypothetical protein
MSASNTELRINARLTGEDARRFRELQKREGLSASDLLRDALRVYHAERTRSRASAGKLLAASGFIGGGDGPVDLSERYKDYLTEAFESKLPTRVHER